MAGELHEDCRCVQDDSDIKKPRMYGSLGGQRTAYQYESDELRRAAGGGSDRYEILAFPVRGFDWKKPGGFHGVSGRMCHRKTSH